MQFKTHLQFWLISFTSLSTACQQPTVVNRPKELTAKKGPAPDAEALKLSADEPTQNEASEALEPPNDAFKEAEEHQTRELAKEAKTEAKDPSSTHSDPIDPRAEALYRKAVEAVKAEDPDRAMELYLDSCQKGWPLSCHRYGWHLYIRGEKKGAQPFFNQACRRGLAKSCYNLGVLLSAEGQVGEAKKYFKKACQGEHTHACLSLKKLER